MGFSISWVGINGISKDAALERLGFRDTREDDEANEELFSVASHGDWVVIWANDFEYFRNRKRLAGLSRGARVIAVCAEEHVMFSGAGEWRDGLHVWQVDHDAQDSLDHIATSGHPPDRLSAVRDAMREQQGSDTDVDFFFDVPTRLAKEITQFKHDETTEFAFTRLEGGDGKQPKKKGWFGL